MNNLLWVIFDALLFYSLILPFYFSLKYTCHGVYFRFSYHWEILLLLGCLIFCIYDKTGGDYFHYKDTIDKICSTRVEVNNNFEMPYMWLISVIGNNYFLFRLFVWGTALLIYVQILKYIRLYNNISISVFILYTLLAFSYGRSALALSIFFGGAIYSYINFEQRRASKVVIGNLLMLLSLFFHKSMIVPVLLAILLVFIRLNKKRILLLLIFLPFLAHLINNVLDDALGNILQIQSSFSEVSSDALNSGVYYLALEKESLGPSQLIPLVLSIPSMILPMIVIGNKIYSAEYTNILPNYIRKFYEMVILLILISFILLFVDTGGQYLYLRIKEMSYIPFSILFSYYLIYLKPSKSLLTISAGAILFQITFYFTYAYYLKSIGSGI